ncbi:MAG TPA: cytochrome c [Novosphingobium sp.]|nr:cytochrome c [Novosphingobium sp.]
MSDASALPDRPPKRRAVWGLLGLTLAFAGYAVLGAERNAASVVLPPVDPSAPAEQRGAAAFLGAGFGGISQRSLESNAIPWKLAAAALVLDEQSRDPQAAADQATLRRVLARFGFLFPERLLGVPEGLTPAFAAKPLGMTHGTIAPLGGAKVEVANLGCAACHSGVGYDAAGNPVTAEAVPGMPNTSLDLESYTQAIFLAMRRFGNDDALLATAERLFPDMDWREKASLRWLVLPLAKSRLAELDGQDRAMPFPNGLPGATNGVAALKAQFGTPLRDGGALDRGFVSIPELALRDRRSRLLTDGAYAAPGGRADPKALAAITSFFTVPSMGVHPDEARSHQGEAEAIFAWLAQYRPPPFPGPVNLEQARRGEAIYARDCAACHGAIRWDSARPELARYTDWVGNVGTDPLRADLFDAPLAKAVGDSGYGDAITVKTGQGYAAPPLAGLWASAPYLHNGSVQSLEALLNPARRLPRFMVGGHALDWNTVGIRLGPDGRYPAGYVPFATPHWVDTALPGLGNGGHTFGQDLTEADRRALIAFLLLL